VGTRVGLDVFEQEILTAYQQSYRDSFELYICLLIFSTFFVLRVEGVAWSAQRIPTAVNLGFLDRSGYFFIQVAPQLSSRG
jgi:hypothetical protein